MSGVYQIRVELAGDWHDEMMKCGEIFRITYPIIYIIRADCTGTVLGLSRCLSQVIFTFFPTPAPEPTVYGDPVNGSIISEFIRRLYRMFPRRNDV